MPKAQYRLVVRQGPVIGQVFELNKNEIFIGRDVANDFIINDAEVSRRHARLTLEGEVYKIEDLNSTNGTYIDGQRLIGPHLLAIGEIIMFGDNVGVVFDGEPATPDVTVPITVDLGTTPVAAIPAPVESYVPPVQSSMPPAQSYVPPAQSTMPPVMPQQPQMAKPPIPAQQMPAAEVEIPEETKKKPVNSWLLAGCGCIVVIVLLCIAVFVFIDQPWNQGGGLYCRAPFDIIFGAFGFCP